MRTKEEHLKAWLQAETREKYPGTEAWDKVVSVIQVVISGVDGRNI